MWLAPYLAAAGAELAVAASLPDAPKRLAAAAVMAEQNSWAAACLARATARLTGDHDTYAQALERWTRIGARIDHAETLLLLPDRAEEGRAELALCAEPAASILPT